MLKAKYCTLVHVVLKVLNDVSRAYLGVFLVFWYSSVRTHAKSRQHSLASVPLWVVRLDRAE